jgi:hypothetical protein
LLPSRGFFVCKLPTLVLHRLNGDSAENCHLIDDEFTGRIVFLPGIASPPKERDFPGNNQLMKAYVDWQDKKARKILQTVTISG